MPSPIHILHFLTDLDRHSGGPTVSVPELCRQLASHEDVSVTLAARPTPEAVRVETMDRFSLRWIAGDRSSVESTLAATAREADGAPIVVHLQGLWDPMFLWAQRQALRRGIPVVISIRGMLLPWALRHKRLKKWIGWRLYQQRNLRRASLLHATSPAEVDSILAAGFSEPPSVSIPNGVTPPPDTDEILASSERRKTLLFLGRIHPVKGLLPLLDAWAKAAPPGWDLRITGPDWEGHQRLVESKIAEHRLQETVKIHPPVEGGAKWRALAEAGCVVLPSFAENFGMSVAEALAMETPVAASTRSPWQSLETEKAGWWIDPDVAPLAAFLESLGGTTAEERLAMGRRGRALVERAYSWPAVGEQFLACYRQLAGA